MSAFNIQLPGVVIAGLYKKSVVQGEEKAVEGGITFAPESAPAPVEAKTTTTVPTPERKDSNPPVATTTTAPTETIAVIVQFGGEAFLPEQHLQLLTKMLGACKLNLGDVAIVNDASRKVEINQLKEQLYPKQVLLFGISPEETGLPLSFPMFKPQEYAGTTYLYTPSLEELNQETEEGKLLKRKLWDNLKQIFAV
jgi:hypothetical protein